MYKVALINMPFAAIHLPSIALTQLAAVLEQEFEGRVQAGIYYLNHDFAQHIGRGNYEPISNVVSATVSGLGDWLFRQTAFPDLEDNSAQYLKRYPSMLGGKLGGPQLELLRGLDTFLDELIDRYALDRYQMAGFTSMFAQNMATFALARKLKERNPDIVTAMGGANCETSMGSVIARNVEAVDFVFSGPSLKTFPAVIGHLMDGDVESCEQIRGVFTRGKAQRSLLNGSGNEIGEELSINVSVPLDYEGFLSSLDQKCPGAEPALLFETSRGCWWGERSHCTFCGLNGTTMRYRSMEPDLALEQFEEIFRYYPRVLRFEACDNILPRQYVKDVLPRLKTPENASIFYEVKADLKDREMQVLANAGVTLIQPGIEALATSTLKLMKKGTTSFHNLRFLKNCLAYNIEPSWNLLIGFPEEPEEVYRKYVEDLPFLVHLPPPSGAYPVRFDRFSPYFTLAKEYKLKLRPMDFYSMVYPFPDQDLDQMAYFLADQNYENAYIGSTAKWLKKLEGLCEDWNTRWYQRDGLLKPALEFAWRGEQRIVVDTRAGNSTDHEPGPTGLRILDVLDQAMKVSRLSRELADVGEQEIETELDELRARGLVFAEGGKHTSLVLGAAEQALERMEW